MYHPANLTDPNHPVEEIWAPLELYGCKQYEISTRGEVRHVRNRRLRAQSVNQYGFPFHTLQEHGYDGRRVSVPVARAVARTFLGEPSPRMPSPTVMHKDGDRMNCALENLVWRPRAYARRYSDSFNEPYEASGRFVLAVDASSRVLNDYASEGDLAQAYGVLVSDVQKAIWRETNLPFNPGVYVMLGREL